MLLNPENEVVKQIDSQWYKLLAVAMHKLGYDKISITNSDIEAMPQPPREILTLIAHARAGSIDLHLMPLCEAEEFARKHGEIL